MSFRDQYDFDVVVNEAERLVIEELGRQLEDPANAAVCKCQDCVIDMAAFALNAVKPLYRVTLLGRLYARAMDSTDYEAQVADAVRAAISRIGSNPSHD